MSTSRPSLRGAGGEQTGKHTELTDANLVQATKGGRDLTEESHEPTLTLVLKASNVMT